MCRVTHIEEGRGSLPQYDKEKYKEMVLDAAETVLGFFGFDRMIYSNIKKGRKKMVWRITGTKSNRHRNWDDLIGFTLYLQIIGISQLTDNTL